MAAAAPEPEAARPNLKCFPAEAEVAPLGLVYLAGPASGPPPSFRLPLAGGQAAVDTRALGVQHGEWQDELAALCTVLSHMIELAGLYTEASGDCLLNALTLGFAGVHDRVPGLSEARPVESPPQPAPPPLDVFVVPPDSGLPPELLAEVTAR